MLRLRVVPRTAGTACGFTSVTSRKYAEYSEKPVAKEKRKPLIHGVLMDPHDVQDIKEYRLAKEWHIFKRRFEVPLMEAYRKFLDESKAQRIEEKKQKRKERRAETAPVRARLHILQKKKHQLFREALIIRPWYVFFIFRFFLVFTPRSPCFHSLSHPILYIITSN